ncbi:MAG: AtpZ/AtpI family protein [Clostridiales bacterium]|nr:AtpZ/AtpI family protein [Clostridiales bacterium]
MNEAPKNQKKQRGGILRALSISSQIGLTIIACLFIGVFIGKYLDSLLNTAPWLLLVFSLTGMAAAFWAVFGLAKKNGGK